MRRALLVSYEPSHFIELRRVARLLKGSGSWEPILYFAKTYPDTPDCVQICHAEGWATRVEGESSAPQIGPSPKRSLMRMGFDALPEPMKRPIRWAGDKPARYALHRARLRAAADHVAEVLREERPSLIVLPEDNVDHLTTVMVKTAADIGIRSVIVPFTVANTLEPAEAYYGNPQYTLGHAERLLFARYPQWVAEHHGTHLVRIPVPEALATEHTGYAPPQPWILNSGHAAAIAVESDAMLAHYRACRLPDSQLVQTGALYDDDLATAMRDRDHTIRRLGLDERPVFLCALPPDQIATRRPDQCEFATHAELARAWIATLCARPEIQVVVCLHPRTPAVAMQSLAGLGARIATDLAQLIPVCDVYVASVSATIRMAIACGKPVINYDVYRYRYTDYDGVPGVFTMESHGEFSALVDRFASNPAARAAAAAEQEAVMTRWALLDGHAGERMLALFERLAS